MSVTTGPLTRRQSTPRSELAREGPFGVFPSAQARAAMWSLYEQKLALWPVPFQELDLPGSFGTTHVVVAGDPDAPPLVLVHMTACPSFIWAPIIGPLAERFRELGCSAAEIRDRFRFITGSAPHFAEEAERAAATRLAIIAAVAPVHLQRGAVRHADVLHQYAFKSHPQSAS